ncbi:hypothetical protein Tco_1083223 [Tanacetum coccineum]
MRTLMTHHDALNKDEFTSDPNTPDMKSSPTRCHAKIKLRKLSENCSDTTTFDMRPPTPRHMNKPKESGSEVMSGNVSASSTPALEEMKKILDEDSASH